MEGEKTMVFVERCIQSLKKWNKIWKASPAETASGADEDPNPVTPRHPVPIIDYRIFDGDESTRNGTELVYGALHKCWPCLIKDHRHTNTLGSIQEARFRLDPQWSFKKDVRAFSVILSGEGMLQESKFHICTKE